MIAYLECFSGAAGDMILAALIDAGARIDKINSALEPIGLNISVESVLRQGMRGLHVSVSGDHPAGNYAEARRSILEAGLDGRPLAQALGVLERLALAEARVHDQQIDEVHFHELSSADTIADVVGVAIALDDLGIDEILVSSIATGRGTIQTEHGTMPALAPATAELLQGFAVHGVEVDGELVTPTAGAIFAATATTCSVPPSMRIDASGYGAGTKQLDAPNLLRVLVGEPVEAPHERGAAVVLSANIDDMNPELYGYALERLFDAGVVDAWLTPAIGKKGRPTVVMSAIVHGSSVEDAKQVFFEETSTIGVRATPVERFMLDREFLEVEVDGKAISVKIARRAGNVVNIAPEYEDCREVARATGRPLKDIYQQATISARERI